MDPTRTVHKGPDRSTLGCEFRDEDDGNGGDRVVRVLGLRQVGNSLVHTQTWGQNGDMRTYLNPLSEMKRTESKSRRFTPSIMDGLLTILLHSKEGTGVGLNFLKR